MPLDERHGKVLVAPNKMDPQVHIVHGHVGYDSAVASLTEFHGKTAEELGVSPEKAKPIWARWVQANRKRNAGDAGRKLCFQDVKSRGAFPVMVLMIG